MVYNLLVEMYSKHGDKPVLMKPEDNHVALLELHQSSDGYVWDHFRKGSRAAFDLIYERYFQVLCAYGDRICTDACLVEDVIQEVFIHLWTKRDKLGATENIKYYLFLCLRRKLLRLMNQQKRKQATVLQDDYVSFPFSLNPTMEEDASQEEKQLKLLNALLSLTDRQKEAIYLRFYNGLTFKEVAEIMDIEVRSVYNLIGRSIEILRGEIRHDQVSTPYILLPLCILLEQLH